MAEASGAARLNPTLFDKLVADSDVSGMRGEDASKLEASRETMRYYSVPRLERFNESALRATVRRELAWLLNTTAMESRIDLDDFPQVKSSVLNYGVPDLAGKALNSRLIVQRARDIRAAVLAFEPRIEAASLVVEPADKVERENSVTFVIHGDVRNAVRAMPVKFRTDVAADSAAVTVRE